MKFDTLPDMMVTILPPIHPDVRPYFYIVMIVFIVAIIWHAHNKMRGW